MLKLLRISILFIFITLLFYFALVWLFNAFHLGDKRAICVTIPYLPRKGGQELQMLSDFRKDSKNDIIVLGSSHAYRGYDPREFSHEGIDLFNMGSSSQHPVASWILLHNLIKKEDVSLVILEVYDRTFELEGMDCTIRLIQQLPGDGASLELLLAQPDLRAAHSFSTRLMTKKLPSEYEAPGYLVDGYCSLQDTLKTPAPESGSEFRKNDIMFSYFEKCLVWLKQNGITCVVVSHPQPAIPSAMKYHQEFRNELDPVLVRHGVQYIDMTNEPWLHHNEHYADENHLNQAGVTIFNQHLIRVLLDDGYLQAHGN